VILCDSHGVLDGPVSGDRSRDAADRIACSLRSVEKPANIGGEGGVLLLPLLLFGCGGGSDSPSGPDNHEAEAVHIVSLSPAHGTHGLSDTVTVSITFDRPVLEVGAILVPSMRGLSGSGGYQQWLVRSEDKLTFSRTVGLLPNTAYQLLVVWALDADSLGLIEASMLSFSTTAEPPTGAISGHIDTPGSYDPDGTVLILVDAYRWIGWEGQNFEDYIMALGWVDDPSGDYSIENLAPGKYYLYAFRNVTGDGSYDEEKSLFGLYGEWGFGVRLLAIDVKNNQTTTGIDFPMFQGRSFFDE
ncbi:MAG: Ig-like domain-containing protein, partial [Candidatus Eisenbacteria bacterium]